MKNLTELKKIGNYSIKVFENPFTNKLTNIVIMDEKRGTCNYPIIYNSGQIAFDFTPGQKVRAWFNVKNLLKHRLIQTSITNNL